MQHYMPWSSCSVFLLHTALCQNGSNSNTGNITSVALLPHRLAAFQHAGDTASTAPAAAAVQRPQLHPPLPHPPLLKRLHPCDFFSIHCASSCAEYMNGSQVFVQKIRRLQEQYGSMRRTRGDGNCFFRSFIYGYLEWLLMNQQEQECQR